MQQKRKRQRRQKRQQRRQKKKKQRRQQQKQQRRQKRLQYLQFYVYEITGNEFSVFTLLDHGSINLIYKKRSLGVHCIETDRELFKVNRTGTTIVPATRLSFGEIVLSDDWSFIDGQQLTRDDYIQLTKDYKLNIQDMMAGTGGLGSV